MTDTSDSARGRPWYAAALRPVVGLLSVAALVSVVGLAVELYEGKFRATEPVTVVSQRAGLVLNTDARVKMRGVEVGRVRSIEERGDGTAAINLAINRGQLKLIPENAQVDIASTTAFGAKFIQLVDPPSPSPQPMHSGQVIDGEHVTVEINTVFEQLRTVLSTIEPAKLNATLGAISSAVSGRGQKISQTIVSLDSFLNQINPSLPNLTRDLADAPTVLGSFADAAPDLMDALSAASTTSTTVVDQQQNLDSFLTSVIGLADIGNDVLGANRQPLTNLLRLLTPLTSLTNEYNQAVYCGVAGILPIAKNPPLNVPGIEVIAGFLWGSERYRYPANLPKVAAKGPPQCTDLPRVPYLKRPAHVVADTGADPWPYNNSGIVLNFDGLKQLLFGPIDGPPRNTAQTGQPG